MPRRRSLTLLAVAVILFAGCSTKTPPRSKFTPAQNLGSPDPALREAAMATFRSRGQEAVPELIDILNKSRSSLARAAAATLIGEAGPRKAGAADIVRNLAHRSDPRPNPEFALCDAFSHPDREVARAAANALGKLESRPRERAVLLRHAALRPGAPHDIVLLVPDLVASLGPEACPLLVDGVIRGEAAARVASLAMLRRLGPDAAGAAPSLAYHLDVEGVREALISIGEPSRAALEAASKVGSAEQTKAAKEFLEKFPR
ncbi:MAG: hypothetical protein HYY18_07155 [Planctomycetes bacterium]|nr:hypothetical protein [Planctomycetota bacterium]